MRFVKASIDGAPRIGIVREDDAVAISRVETALEDHFGDDGSHLQELAERILADPVTEAALDDLVLLAPVQPTSMRDFMVFEEHILPLFRARGDQRPPDVWYERPIGYFSNVASIHGPRDAIAVPGGSERLDFELEIGAIVGRTARSVTEGAAGTHIAGYLILCDWSARDLQRREMEGGLGPLKGKDFTSSLGPVLVTPDEIAERRKDKGYDLEMTSAVNGRRYGGDVWSSATWSFEELLSYASWNSVVESGALIGSGTCQGGCISELSTRNGPEDFPWLTDGDEVELTVEAMGSIRARITPSERGEWPHLRRGASVSGNRSVE